MLAFNMLGVGGHQYMWLKEVQHHSLLYIEVDW